MPLLRKVLARIKQDYPYKLRSDRSLNHPHQTGLLPPRTTPVQSDRGPTGLRSHYYQPWSDNMDVDPMTEKDVKSEEHFDPLGGRNAQRRLCRKSKTGSWRTEIQEVYESSCTSGHEQRSSACP